MEEKERYYYKEYAGDYDILDRNDKNAYYGAISRDEEDAQNLINLLNQQSKQIKELEEENNFLEKRNEELMIDRRDICLERNDIFEENQQLKQQLAEKEKEIESYKHFKITIGTMENNQVDISSTTYADQDKISFALEQLEKVKNIILNERKITSFKFDTFNKGKDTALFWLNEQINQQINELKGEK